METTTSRPREKGLQNLHEGKLNKKTFFRIDIVPTHNLFLFFFAFKTSIYAYDVAIPSCHLGLINKFEIIVTVMSKWKEWQLLTYVEKNACCHSYVRFERFN